MTTNSWYADGLRWLGTVLNGFADHLERVSLPVVPLEPHPDLKLPEDHAADLRRRIQSYY